MRTATTARKADRRKLIVRRAMAMRRRAAMIDPTARLGDPGDGEDVLDVDSTLDAIGGEL